MNDQTRKLIEEKAKERASRYNVSWSENEIKHDIATFIAGAEAHAELVESEPMAKRMLELFDDRRVADEKLTTAETRLKELESELKAEKECTEEVIEEASRNRIDRDALKAKCEELERTMEFRVQEKNNKLFNSWAITIQERDEARAQCEKLAAALEFYADDDNWSECTDQTTSHMIGPDDHAATVPFGKKFKAGLKAKTALEEYRKGGA